VVVTGGKQAIFDTLDAGNGLSTAGGMECRGRVRGVESSALIFFLLRFQ
jgi:hypothetical protein